MTLEKTPPVAPVRAMVMRLYDRILHGLREPVLLEGDELDTASQRLLIAETERQLSNWIYDECAKDCATCGEGSEVLAGCPLGECGKSKRVCGHHCNCIWTQDACCWCGHELSDEGVD